MKRTANNKLFHYYYDQEADVCYISKGKPSKTDMAEEVGEDVVARFNPKTREIRGLTIINFSKRFDKKLSDATLPFEVDLHSLVNL